MQDLIELINSALPQYQCGRCDTPGCRPYAKEIAEGSPITIDAFQVAKRL